MLHFVGPGGAPRNEASKMLAEEANTASLVNINITKCSAGLGASTLEFCNSQLLIKFLPLYILVCNALTEL